MIDPPAGERSVAESAPRLVPAPLSAPMPDSTCLPEVEEDDRCEAWDSVYDYPGGYGGDGEDFATAVATGPDPSVAFVTGASWSDETAELDAVTIAYDAATGIPRWIHRYDGPSHSREFPYALAVSSDGRRLYVAGVQDRAGTAEEPTGDLIVLAYDAATGGIDWISSYAGPAGLRDTAYAIALTADDERLIFTGESIGGNGQYDAITGVLDTDDGALRWITRWDNPAAGLMDRSVALAHSPGGDRVYVAGYSKMPGDFRDHAWFVLAYDRDGNELWRVNRDVNEFEEYAYDIETDPAGSRVYVTGVTRVAGTTGVTIAYDAATGAQRWATSTDWVTELAIAPGGDYLYVLRGNGEFVVTKLQTTTGQMIYDVAYQYDAPIFSVSATWAIELAPGGHEILVSGFAYDQVIREDLITLGLDAETGARRWVAHYDHDPGIVDAEIPFGGLAVAADGSRAFVAGFFSHLVDTVSPHDDATDNYTDLGVVSYDLAAEPV